MAGILGHTTGQVVYGNDNPRVSSELDDLTEVVSQFDFYDVREVFNAYTIGTRLPEANRRGILGEVEQSFKADFYERIHLFPSRMDLGTVANEQTRQLSVWNAFTTVSAVLDDVVVTNGGGVSITGPVTPITFTPLQEMFWEIKVTPNGPPQINASVFFDFDNVPDPKPLIVTGTRAALLPIVPEVPVTEVWEWLTDEHVSIDGTEQRVGLRKHPRRRQSTQLVFLSAEELREQYRVLLSAVGRLFVPYFQYSARTTAAAAQGSNSLAFDTGLVDVRNGDYVMVETPDTVMLLELDVVGSGSASTRAPLGTAVPKNSLVVAVFPSFVNNKQSINRNAVNEYGDMTLTSDASYPRPLQRALSTAVMTMFDGYPVLERRPMANDDIKHTFDTGQVTSDAKTGLQSVDSYWKFTRVEQAYQFMCRRVGRGNCGYTTGVTEMDYWRLFFDTMKGSLNSFLMSSYRPDQTLFSDVAPGSSSMVFNGAGYADNFFPAAPYHYLAITTAKGVHYAKVTSAVKDAGGNSSVTFDPALPAGEGWDDVLQVSYLLKLRIAEDKVTLEHLTIDTIFGFTTRTVEE